MTQIKVVTPDQWATARGELLAKEREAARTLEAVNAARREMPAVKVDKGYQFDGQDGTAILPELFDGRRQLITYHFMFDPAWDTGCRLCSHVVDNIGHLAHLHALDTTLVLVSRAPLAKLTAHKERMGWSIPWFSSFGSDFNDDFQATVDGQERGGFSVFLRPDESVLHTYSAFDEGVDLRLLDRSYVDVAPLGLQDGQAERPWPQLHDEYSA